MRRSTAVRTVRLLCGVLSAVVVGASSAATNAQDPAPSVESAPPVSGAPLAQPPPAVPLTPPPAASPPAATRAADPDTIPNHSVSDFDVEARRWAIGYAGLSQVPVGLTATGADITVPAIGLRYWTSPTVGIDVALGFGWSGGSTEAAGMSIDKNSVYGFLLQGGVPVALSTRRHVSFQVVPFAAIAHGRTSAGTGFSAIAFRGTRADVGARAGFELFFGFIGIPELALNATIGMQFEMRKYRSETGGLVQSDTTLSVSTTVQNNPWDIFNGNVAARYYF